MHAEIIVAIVFSSIVIGIAIVCGTILLAIKSRRGGLTRRTRQQAADEAKMIQDMYRGLSQMEKRVDALETILMDRQRKDQ
jgi:phage shock protein B